MAAAHEHRYNATNNLEEIDLSLKYSHAALSLMDQDHPIRTLTMHHLGCRYQWRFEDVGTLSDLDTALSFLRCALASTTADDPAKPHRLKSLGDALAVKSRTTGDLAHLEDAVILRRQALESKACRHGVRASTKINLGHDLLELYRRNNEADLLAEAVEHLRDVTESVSTSLVHASRTVAEIHLAIALQTQYEDLGDLEALKAAVSLFAYLSETVEPDFHGKKWIPHQYAEVLHSKQLLDRSSGSTADVDEAIKQVKVTLDLLHLGDFQRHRPLLILGSCLSTRFMITRDRQDMLNALEIYQQIQQTLPVDHPDLPLALSGRARLLFADNSPSNIGEAIGCLVSSVQHKPCHSQLRLAEAIKTLQQLEEAGTYHFGDLNLHIAEACRLTVSLLPQVAFLVLNSRSKLRSLSKAADLANQAAVRCLQAERIAWALEVLEEGRAVFWSQHLKLRSSFDSLPDDISQSLNRASDELRQSLATTAPSGKTEIDDSASRAQLESEAAKMRRLSERFEGLLAKARSLPGQDRLLMPPTYDVLARVADAGPVVVLLTHRSGCYAIVLNKEVNPLTCIRLNGMSTSALDSLSGCITRSNPRARSLSGSRALKLVKSRRGFKLGGLWNAAMRPIIVDTLQLTAQTESARPRLHLCATGLFTRIPLHAAGSPESSCSNYCVISYTPTLTALLDARRIRATIRKEDARVLLAAVTQPFKGLTLPSVVDEAEVVSNIVTTHGGHALSLNGHALTRYVTGDELLARLPGTSILHLACHGEQSAHDPLDSGFLMCDRKVTVAQLMGLDMPSGFLAFLSACDTAKGDTNQPDQAIHLAAAMLFAGFKSVVGTMWAMNDADGPLVAETVYRALYEGDSEYLDPEVIPYALDAAVSKLRARGCHPSRWAPYIHMGV